MPSSSKPHRKSIRLKGYDYATPGFYFITICTHRRAHLFGEIVDGAMRLSVLGQMVAACYQALPEKYAAVRVWDSVVMPNHFHCLLEIVDVSPEVSKLPKVGQVVGYFKYMTTRRANLPHPCGNVIIMNILSARNARWTTLWHTYRQIRFVGQTTA